MNHRPYGLAGTLSAKVKGFTVVPRSPNVVMRKVISGYQVGTMPDGYNKVTYRPDKTKRAKLESVQFFKTESDARVYMDSLLAGGL